MKNAFYFTSKALFVLKIFKFLSWLFGHVSKRLDWKDKVNFKFYDVTAWLTNKCNTHMPNISRCLILFLMFACSNFSFRAFVTMIYWKSTEVLLNLVTPLDLPSLALSMFFELPALIPLVLYLIRSVLAAVYLNCISRFRFKCSFFWPWENQ